MLGPLIHTLAFLVGIEIVLGSVEKFIEYVTDAAAHLGISAFLLIVVFAGADWENAVLSLTAISGEFSRMVLGSEITVTSARGILAAFRLDGRAFGATVISVIASLEKIFLTVEPVRQNRPEIGIGNIVGSTLFFVTVNAGSSHSFAPSPLGRRYSPSTGRSCSGRSSLSWRFCIGARSCASTG